MKEASIKTYIFLLTLLSCLVLNQKLLRFPLVFKSGSEELDNSNSNKFLEEISGTQKFHYAGIYKLALSQGRNKIAYFTKLKLGKDKQEIEFMIDTGIYTFIKVLDGFGF